MGNCAGTKTGDTGAGTQWPPLPKEPRAIPKGSKVFLLKQDPSVSLGYRLLWVPEEIKPGPATADIQIVGLRKPLGPSDDQGNYLYEFKSSPIEADMVNTLATVNLVQSMYRRALNRMNITKPLDWQWGSEPISVYPRAGEWENAYYDRSTKSLRFFYFEHPEKPGYTVYTCRSFDIVAHEAGHAILDAIKPDYITSIHPHTGALHEAFGDVTAIFGLLEQLDVCAEIISASKCDLHKKTFFTMIGEEFGVALGEEFGLRNADNNLTMSEAGSEIHDLSRVFTGAVYDILVEMFELALDLDQYDPSAVLHRTGRHLSSIFVAAILNAPDKNATFKQVANEMIAAATEKRGKEIIRKHFDVRQVFSTNFNLAEYAADPANIKHSCASMRAIHDPEFRAPNLDERRSGDGGATDEEINLNISE